MKYKVVSYFLSLLIFGLFTYYGIQWTVTTSNEMLAMTNQDAAERQIIRKKILKEYCLTHKHDTNNYRSRQNMGYIIVDDEQKIMYCTIPKVGTTTWKRVLANLRGLKRGIYVHRWNLWKRLYQYTEEERAIRIRTYFKFLFVREPLHRLLSAFKNKFIGGDLAVSRSARQSIIRLYRPQDLGKGNNKVSFSEFIKYFSTNRSRNQHWREYGKLCHPCYVNYDLIGHLETLGEDAPLVLKMAGIGDLVTFPPVHGSTGTDEVLKYYSQFPPEDITRIGELYRDDFETFGYEFPGPVRPLMKLNFTELNLKRVGIKSPNRVD